MDFKFTPHFGSETMGDCVPTPAHICPMPTMSNSSQGLHFLDMAYAQQAPTP